MQNGPPIIRRSSLRRPTRGQLARRRAAVVIVVVLVLVGIWQFWPAGGSAGTNAAGPGGSTSQPTSAGPSASVIVPGENPIKHVIFLVKENHSFDNYFGKYPGADGATEGPTLKCDQGFAPGPTVPLTDAPYIVSARSRARIRPGPHGDRRRQDGRLQLRDVRGRPDRVHAVRSQDAARLLGAGRSVHARRSLLHVDVRPDVPGASVHDRGAVLRHRRQQDHRHRARLRQLLRRSHRAHTSVPDRGSDEPGRQNDHGSREPVPRWTRRTCSRSPPTGSTRAPASTSRSCPISSSRTTSAGSTTRRPTSG